MEDEDHPDPNIRYVRRVMNEYEADKERIRQRVIAWSKELDEHLNGQKAQNKRTDAQ